MAQKPDDRWAVPMKHAHHMRQHAFGDELGFWAFHDRDPFALALRCNRKYLVETGKDAAEHFPLRRAPKSHPKAKRSPRATPRRSRAKQKIASRPNPWPKGRKIKSRGFK